MGRNPLVSSLLCSSRLPPEDSSHSCLISPTSDTRTASIFFSFSILVLFIFLGAPASSDLPLLSADHTFRAVRCLSRLFSASALMGISNILGAGLHMEMDKSRRNGTVMRYQSPNLLRVKGAVIPLFWGGTGDGCDGGDSEELNSPLFISVGELSCSL